METQKKGNLTFNHGKDSKSRFLNQKPFSFGLDLFLTCLCFLKTVDQKANLTKFRTRARNQKGRVG